MQKKQPILHELGPLLTLEVFKLEIIIKTQLFKLSEDAKIYLMVIIESLIKVCCGLITWAVFPTILKYN